MDTSYTAREWTRGDPPQWPHELHALMESIEDREFFAPIKVMGLGIDGSRNHWLIANATIDGRELLDAIAKWMLVFGSQAEDRAGRRPEPPEDFTEDERSNWDGFDDEEVCDGEGGWTRVESRILADIYDFEHCSAPATFGKRCVNPNHVRITVDANRYDEHVEAVRRSVNGWCRGHGIQT
jgi:hypothetical protein